MLRILLLLILSNSIVFSSFSQKYLSLPNWNVDSLLRILPDQQEEKRANSLNRIAISLSFIDFDSSLQYAEEAMKLSKELNYEAGIAASFRNFGYIYQYAGNYPLALKNYLEAISRYENLNDKKMIALIYIDIARTHYFSHNFKKTIEYSMIAMDKFREPMLDGTTIGNSSDTLRILSGISLMQYLTDSCNKSLDITLEVIDAAKHNHFTETEFFLNQILAGERYYCVGKKDSAILYLETALDYPNNNPSIEALKYRAIVFLGRIHFNEGEYDKAIVYVKKAFDYYQETGFLYWANITSNFLGYVYIKKNQLDIAEAYYLKSEIIFSEILSKNSWYRNDSLKNIVSWGIELYFPLPSEKIKDLTWQEGEVLYYMLYKINSTKGKSDEALKYHIAYASADDTLNKLRRSRELIELQTKFETERIEEDLEYLSQENAIQELKLEQSRFFVFSLSGLVIIIILIALFTIRFNKLRDKQHSLMLQQKLFRSQMNPHFIFNSLTSIQNFILDEEPGKASKYLSRFSKLVRHILDSTVEEFVTLEEEISTIENYLELQKIRFKGKFEYSIDIDEKINPENISLPPMLAQPFIENSIEHGIKNKKAKGNIYIRFYLKNNHIVFEVEDDGVGREKAQEILYQRNKDHKSHATAITYERIRVLNKKLKEKIILGIKDLVDNNNEPVGTKVILQIPVI